MGTQIPKVHIFFFPIMAQGNALGTADMAKLFAARGVKATIITTPFNASFFSKTIQRSQKWGMDIDIKILKPSNMEVGPEDEADVLPTSHDGAEEIISKFYKCKVMLQEPLEQLLQEYKPDCLIANMFFPWATDAADKFGIPRLVFYGIGFFPSCVTECIAVYEPHKSVESESEKFVVPNLPGNIKFTKNQLPYYVKEDVESDFTKMMEACRESEFKSFGVIINSFYELEPVYADFYRNVLGRNAWHIGPVTLCNRTNEDKAGRGMKSEIDEQECLNWLDSKKTNSVVYICFGSMTKFTSAQLKEIAMALEASGQEFIWVVNKDKDNGEKEDWLPEGFEKRIGSKGLMITGWAPQVMILDQEAVGGFVTHCGWNSTLEAVSAGVPMVTWPVSAEQFYNEKLLTEIMKIGVAVGVEKWVPMVGDFVRSEAIEKAINKVMKGETAEELRGRAKALAQMAKKAVAEGGSSYSDLDRLIQELVSLGH